MDEIRANTLLLSQLNVQSGDPQVLQAEIQRLDALVSRTVREAARIKATLCDANALDEWRRAMQEFSAAANTAKQRLVDVPYRNIANAAEALGQPLERAQITLIIEHGQADEFLQQLQLLEGGASVRDLVLTIEVRHTRILHLERQCLELLELMRDLSLLVDLQQTQANSIDRHGAIALASVGQGERQLTDAQRVQQVLRRRRCWMLLIALLLLLLMASVTVCGNGLC
jgi:hypothetical protein